MQQRCYNPNQRFYSYYGGRGITVCQRWRQNFELFLEDMGEVPIDKSLDRINNDQGYWCGHCDECITKTRKSNCRWATREEQGRNRRNSRRITINGETRSLPDWAEHFGITHQLLRNRIYKGWSLKEAVVPRLKSWGRMNSQKLSESL